MRHTIHGGNDTMRNLMFTVLIGALAGIVDILPMIKMKLDKYSIASAFVFYFILPFVILNIDLFGMAWWSKGGVTAFALAMPMIILVAKEDRKSIPPMVVMSLVLGTLIGAAGHFIF